jgi:predicted DNA binding protein
MIFNSCSPKEEEYVATIRVINNSNSIIKNFILKADVENKIIETLELDEEYEFQVKWIGRYSSFLSGMDNSYIVLEITYSIDNKIFDITNEKGAFIDSYGNYYSEKTITDGSKINIKINDNGYEIIYEH